MLQLIASNGKRLDKPVEPATTDAVAREIIADELTAIFDQVRYLNHTLTDNRLRRVIVLCEFDDASIGEIYLAGGRSWPDAGLLLQAEALREFALEGPNTED